MMIRLLRSARIVGGFFLVVGFLALLASAAHAQPVVVNFPSIPCDSTACDSLVLTNSSTDGAELIVLDMRDSTSFSVAISTPLPITIAASGRFTLPICFTPARRGNISDSLLIVVRRGVVTDTVRARLTGKGLGPVLDAVPNVLNFPKTNPASTSSLTMKIYNNGEEAYDLTAAKLPVPPPFALVTTLPLRIAPGDSVEIEITFTPPTNGIYSKQVDLPVGCNTQLQLGFNGVTDLIGTGAVLRISKTGFNPVNDEQIPCDSIRCTTLTLSNIGNAPLIVEGLNWLVGTLGYTITNPPAVPFIIAPQDHRDVQICLSSKQRGTLRDTLLVTSNTRSSIAFGILIDVSGSMKATMNCNGITSTRIEEAKTQAKNFIGRTVLYLPTVGIQDQLAISTYTTYQFSPRPLIEDIFPLTAITDAQRIAAQNTITAVTTGDGTPTGAGLLHMIDVVAQSPLKNRVIVLLTDGIPSGNDAITNPITTVIARANQAGIRVFTIALDIDNPTGRTYLRQLVDGTGGQGFEAVGSDCRTLQEAFEAITDIVSRGGRTTEPFRIKIQSPFLVTLNGVTFDSVHVGGTICRSITVTNAGEGTALLDSAQFLDLLGQPTNEFYLQAGTQFPILIPESGQANLTICFNPKKIRVREGEMRLFYNDCGSVPTSAGLSGAAWAGANLRISDSRIGLPGTNVTLPVYADSSLEEYSVNTIVYSLRWNKTMLDLRGVTPGARSGGATLTISKPVSYGPRYATVEITANGTGLPGGGELAQVEFTVLRGDSLATAVELTQGLFEDNNPKTSLVNAGLVQLDSTCFRDSKPVSIGTVAKVSVGDVSPNPVRGAAVKLPLESDGAGTLRFTLYNSDGAQIAASRDVAVTAGKGAIEIDIAGLAAGSYYVMVRTPDGASLFRKLLIVR